VGLDRRGEGMVRKEEGWCRGKWGRWWKGGMGGGCKVRKEKRK